MGRLLLHDKRRARGRTFGFCCALGVTAAAFSDLDVPAATDEVWIDVGTADRSDFEADIQMKPNLFVVGMPNDRNNVRGFGIC